MVIWRINQKEIRLVEKTMIGKINNTLTSWLKTAYGE